MRTWGGCALEAVIGGGGGQLASTRASYARPPAFPHLALIFLWGKNEVEILGWAPPPPPYPPP